MITYATIVQQIERQLVLAKSTTNDSEIRESMSAIRALCDVALASQSQQLNVADVSVVPTITQQKPLAEEDANGHSLFDF